MQSFVINLLNGVSYGLLLFMLSAGLTLIFSMLGVLNFAHASFYMLGAYVGFSVAAHAGFWSALMIAPLIVGLIGAALERWLLRRVRVHGHLPELLLTFGAAYLLGELVKLGWGLSPLSATVPAALDGPLFTVYGAAFARYRAFMMVVSLAMLVVLYAVLRVSKTGLIVRAALTHASAVEALGHNVPRVFTGVFAAGTALAALAGVIGAPLFVIEPAMAESLGSIVFVVVVIGGLGSLSGALAASLIVGCVQTFAVASDVSLGDLTAVFGGALPAAWDALTLAQLAPLIPYLLLVAMLALRPRGLFGRRDDHAEPPDKLALPAATRRSMLRLFAPWLALALFLVVPPFVWPQSWLLAYLAQTATMIVFALSYNLLLGETGLLSFGHAAYSGLGALIAAQVFNRVGVPLVLLPLVGGIGGALCGVLFGFVSTRRAGTAFAMITLGIGELVAAAAWTLPDWFGGEAGVPIDRASGPMLASWSFGPAREAYALIALWCVLASVAMFALSRTPLMRLANAVRDNPARAAAIGCYPRRIRYGVVVMSAFFAGIAGTLGLINVELVSTESVGMMRSGVVLIATVIGGTAAFFGPVAGAIVLTFFSVAVASLTRAWLFYLGLFFIVVVVASPDGLAGFVQRHTARVAAYGWRVCKKAYLWGAASAVFWTLAVVLAVQWAYAVQFGADDGAAFNVIGVPLKTASPHLWLGVAVFMLAAPGALAARYAVRAQARLALRASASTAQITGDA